MTPSEAPVCQSCGRAEGVAWDPSLSDWYCYDCACSADFPSPQPGEPVVKKLHFDLDKRTYREETVPQPGEDAAKEQELRSDYRPRVERCIECGGFVSEWVEAEHRNGRICRPCESVLQLRSTVSALEKELAQENRAVEELTAACSRANQDGHRTANERDEARAELARVREAAKALSDRLSVIHANEDYKAVWTLWHSHFGQYKGPQYGDELSQLDAALRDKTTEA